MSNTLQGTAGPIYARAAPAPGSFIVGAIVFPATVNVADPAGLTDGNTSTLSLDSAGRLRTLVSPASGVIFPVNPAVLAQSVGATGRAVTPGAGAAIVTIAAGALPAGTYDVEAFAQYDVGAPVAAEINNMEFRRGAVVISALSVLAIINVYSPRRLFRMVMDGATALSINATGAGTAGVGYNAELLATRIA